ncbi:hypothetical protein [uncultured Reyranella sp.]|uniref:hypothetical protein n=1 Tax=uncultured Reyranella sp. TaxID=735512 RepID=UPI0025EC8728|nr:hypothetical protein [uncultured Reyranella sp.]
MLVVGEPKRIDRAIRRLQGALQGVPARGVRLTWRGGELRTTIHWARDDAFWWAFEPRRARDALVLGHAPEPPPPRESITCEINLPRTGADRKLAGMIVEDAAGALYLAHSGRMGGARPGQSKDGFREFLADGVWRSVEWPDGEESEALIVAPLDSPRLTRLLGRFVDAVRRYKAGGAAPLQTALCTDPSTRLPPAAACDRALVDAALYEELTKRGVFGGTTDLFSVGADGPRPLFGLIADGQPEEVALAVGALALAAARLGTKVKPILVAPLDLPGVENGALASLPFPCVRFQWRGARAVFDGLDDALA